MVESAGHTILVSGSTLVFCFLGMVFFPMDLLQSVGIGSAVALVMALTANLTLNPALLFILTPCLMKIHNYINLEKLPFYKQGFHEFSFLIFRLWLDPSKPAIYNLDLNDDFERDYQYWKRFYLIIYHCIKERLIKNKCRKRDGKLKGEGNIISGRSDNDDNEDVIEPLLSQHTNGNGVTSLNLGLYQ